ncbi:PREDICTED: ras-related protein Rab-21-like [Acropora digitifera]|nr:PREDICTED: ras-related protein Rab-21-like [Acropora digitifera]
MLGEDIALCIAGNKIDLEKDRHVDAAEADAYAKTVGAKHFHTSAKLNKGIEEMFFELTKKMLERQEKSEPRDGLVEKGNGRRKNVLIVDEQQPQQQKSGGCCGGGGS